MPNSDVGEVAGAIKSISDLVGGILTRHDRDEPDQHKAERLAVWQDGFARNDVDVLGILVQQLLIDAGHPATPSGNPGLYKREIFHALGLACIDLVHERELARRAIAKLTSI